MAKGTIAIEEAVIDPSYLSVTDAYASIFNPKSSSNAPPSTTAPPPSAIKTGLLDIHNKRLASMDAHGVEFMVLSLTSPGPQGEPDAKLAEKMATETNDWLAGEVAKNPQRFGAFAALSMHSPRTAAAELERAVKQLGMVGGLINDYQTVPEGTPQGEKASEDGKKYYDTPEYDVLWEKFEKLGVPCYLHPRYPLPEEVRRKWKGRTHLLGAGVQFHLELSWHVYALCSSGEFLSSVQSWWSRMVDLCAGVLGRCL